MTTKLWIYFFTLIGTIINMILLTYTHVPAEFSFNYIVVVAALTLVIADISDNDYWKGFFRGISALIFIYFMWYISNLDIDKIFGDYAPFWLLIIAVIGAYRNYKESKDKHRKNLVYTSQRLVYIMSLHRRINAITANTANTNTTNTIEREYLFNLWFLDMERAVSELQKELLASNFWSDFSISELWKEITQWIDSETRSNCAIRKKYSFRKISQCVEMKLGEEVALRHAEFLEILRTGQALPDYNRLMDTVNIIKSPYNDDETISDYNLVERYSY